MSTAAFTDIGTLITSTPGVNGGRPCVAGTGTSVQHVSVLFNGGLTAEEIASELPHIGLGSIYAAIAFYLANKEAIDEALEDDGRLGERLAKEHEANQRAAATRGG